MSDPFIAEIRIWANNFAPRGWAYCNGQLLAIAQNTALFSLIGTIYGGDGRTTFALPDLRGRVPIHAGSGPGLSPRKLGAKAGSENETLTVECGMPEDPIVVGPESPHPELQKMIFLAERRTDSEEGGSND